MWFRRALQLVSSEDRLDAEIGDTLLQLAALLDEADRKGLQFRPSARLARKALQSIYWR